MRSSCGQGQQPQDEDRTRRRCPELESSIVIAEHRADRRPALRPAPRQAVSGSKQASAGWWKTRHRFRMAFLCPRSSRREAGATHDRAAKAALTTNRARPNNSTIAAGQQGGADEDTAVIGFPRILERMVRPVVPGRDPETLPPTRTFGHSEATPAAAGGRGRPRSGQRHPLHGGAAGCCRVGWACQQTCPSA